MTTFRSPSLKQTAVYWGNPANDGAGGRSFDDPVEISVRWEEKQELFIDASGQEVRSNAVVFVGQDLDLGGYLALTDLDSLSSSEEGDPLTVDAAYEVRGWSKIPNLKGNKFVRKAWL